MLASGYTILVQRILRFGETLDQVHISCRKLDYVDTLTNYDYDVFFCV